MDEERKRALSTALGASFGVTLLIGVGALVIPKAHIATFVGLAFLGATWLFVWRESDEIVEKHALALGGLLLSPPISFSRAAKSALVALAWSLGACALIFVPYYFLWRLWWHPTSAFNVVLDPKDFGSDVLGQLLLIALPEEAFYRGLVQSRLDVVWIPKWRVLGANIGPSLFVTAAIFAVGHVVTIQAPARLAVFFPALLFGWMRARTHGIGAGVVFHAACNIYSELLGRGYGAY